MITTTIITVGTSLITNTERSFPELKNLLELNDSRNIALVISQKEIETVKKLSAELNSTISMIQAGLIEKARMFLIASDTPNGSKAADTLAKIFSIKNSLFYFNSVEVVTVKDLNGKDYKQFKRSGLKNLVSAICGIIRQYGDGSAINNTGGYKAEIAYAGIIGQAFSIPVYYQHEDFGSMIELPPLPISVNIGLWRDNAELFMELQERDQMIAPQGWNADGSAITQLIDTETIDGIELIALSAAGYLFIQSCKYNLSKIGYFKQTDLIIDDTDPTQKVVTLSGDHHGNGLLYEFGRRLCRSPFVKRITASRPYNPKATNSVKRLQKIGKSWFIDFVMTGTEAGYTLCAETTARSEEEAKTIAVRIISEYIT